MKTPEIQKTDFDNLCLSCLSKDCIASVFFVKFEGAALSSILEDILNVQVTVDDPLPKKICEKCATKIVRFHMFKKRFIESQTTLKKVLREKDDDQALVEDPCEELSEDERLLSSDSEDETLRDIYGIPKDLNIMLVDLKTAKKELEDEGFLSSNLKLDGKVETIVCTCEGASPCLYHIQIKNEPKVKIKETTPNLNNSKITKDKEEEAALLQLNKYKCKTCEQVMDISEKLQHRRMHRKPQQKRFLCETCPRIFVTKKQLFLHKTTHTGEKPYICEICGHRFTRETRLKEHLLRHTGEKPFICEYCGKSFAAKRHLTTHQLTHTKPYNCELCSKSFVHKRSFNLHIRIKHLGETPFKCTHCPNTYTTMMRLTNHQKTHGIASTTTNELCHICDKEFASKTKLKAHLCVHANKRFACKFCDKKFHFKYALESHQTIHTGERPFPCKHCNQTFRTVSSLRTHMFWHTGERPHKCNICGKGFIQRHHLKFHLTCHTGELPYSCPYCNKKFRCKFNMDSHVRLHTGEKPFKCDICSKEFHGSTYVRKHKIRVHQTNCT